jgi:hypothetical protein
MRRRLGGRLGMDVASWDWERLEAYAQVVVEARGVPALDAAMRSVYGSAPEDARADSWVQNALEDGAQYSVHADVDGQGLGSPLTTVTLLDKPEVCSELRSLAFEMLFGRAPERVRQQLTNIEADSELRDMIEACDFVRSRTTPLGSPTAQHELFFAKLRARGSRKVRTYLAFTEAFAAWRPCARLKHATSTLVGAVNNLARTRNVRFPSDGTLQDATNWIQTLLRSGVSTATITSVVRALEERRRALVAYRELRCEAEAVVREDEAERLACTGTQLITVVEDDIPRTEIVANLPSASAAAMLRACSWRGAEAMKRALRERMARLHIFDRPFGQVPFPHGVDKQNVPYVVAGASTGSSNTQVGLLMALVAPRDAPNCRRRRSQDQRLRAMRVDGRCDDDDASCTEVDSEDEDLGAQRRVAESASGGPPAAELPVADDAAAAHTRVRAVFNIDVSSLTNYGFQYTPGLNGYAETFTAGRTYKFTAKNIHVSHCFRVGTAVGVVPDWITGDSQGADGQPAGLTTHRGTITMAIPDDYVGGIVLYCERQPGNVCSHYWAGPPLAAISARVGDRLIETEIRKHKGPGYKPAHATRGMPTQGLRVARSEWNKWDFVDAKEVFVERLSCPMPRVTRCVLVPASAPDGPPLPDGVQPCSFLRAALNVQAADSANNGGAAGYSIGVTSDSYANQPTRRKTELRLARHHPYMSDAKPVLSYYRVNQKYLSQKHRGRLYVLRVETDHPGIVAHTKPFRVVARHLQR